MSDDQENRDELRRAFLPTRDRPLPDSWSRLESAANRKRVMAWRPRALRFAAALIGAVTVWGVNETVRRAEPDRDLSALHVVMQSLSANSHAESIPPMRLFLSRSTTPESDR